MGLFIFRMTSYPPVPTRTQTNNKRQKIPRGQMLAGIKTRRAGSLPNSCTPHGGGGLWKEENNDSNKQLTNQATK